MALLTGWSLWILSLVWFFPFVSHYFFAFKFPKPYPVTRPFASPDFFAKGLGIAFSLSDPIGSASSVMWRSTQRREANLRLHFNFSPPFRFGNAFRTSRARSQLENPSRDSQSSPRRTMISS